MSDEFIRQSLVVFVRVRWIPLSCRGGRTVCRKGDLGRFNPHKESSVVVPGGDSGRKGGNPKRGIEHNPVVN